MKTKKQFTNKLLSIVLALVMVLGMVPMTSLTVFAATVGATYVDLDGKTQTVTATVVASGTTTMESGWYVVSSEVTVTNYITINGNVNLILADGAKLTVNNEKLGLNTSLGDVLTIWGGTNNTGKLICYSSGNNAAIGPSYDDGGSIIINGGTVQATSDGLGAAIGAGNGGNSNASVTINGGNVVASSDGYATAIGGGYFSKATVIINGGNITASQTKSVGGNSGQAGAAIGGGYQGNYTTVTINGGVINASNDSTGRYANTAIGFFKNGLLTINGGTINARVATSDADAIGGGSYGDDTISVIINGGNVHVSGGGIAANAKNGYPTNSDNMKVSGKTITLDGVTDQVAVTAVKGITYGVTDVYTLDSNKLYFYLPADTVATSISAGGTEYICHDSNLNYYASHDWSNKNGVCAHCNETCDHKNQTGNTCEICGKSFHTHSYTYAVNPQNAAQIIESCTCGHSATAKLVYNTGSGTYSYTGSAIQPLKVDYSDNWQGGTLEITYQNNTAASTDTSKASGSIKKDGAMATQSFTIIKATMSGITVNGYSGEYDGKAHSISITGVPTGATVTYRTNEDGEYTATNPSYTEKGSYTVWYKIEKANYETVAGSETVVISQTTNVWTTTPSISGWTYGENANEPSYAAKFGTVNVEYRLASGTDADYTNTVPTQAGSYLVRFSVDGNANYTSLLEVKELEIAQVKLTVTADDQSKTYGEIDPELTYTVDDKTPLVQGDELVGEIVRTVNENVGVYAITQGTLTNDNNPNYDIDFVEGIFTVEPDVSGIEGLDQYNVKSTNKADVEYVYNQLVNAETDLASADKKAEWEEIKDDCWQWLKILESVAYRVESLGNSYLAYDINTVTSADDEELLSLEAEMYLFMRDYRDNMTEEELLKVDNARIEISELRNRIAETTKEYNRVISLANGYDEAVVKSSDKDEIEKLIADIKVLTDATNITADERALLNGADETCDKLLAKIAETTAEYDRVIALANGYDEATVTSADKDDLIQLNNDIYALALTNNVTADEKTTLMNSHINVFSCIQRITYVSNEIKRIVEAVDKYVFESVKSDDKADIEQLITDIKNLTDTQNITADERTLLDGADETCDKLIAKIDETVAEINRINDATNAYDIDTVTSADKADIEKLIADIKALTDGDNITDTEREQLNGNDSTLDALLERINATADEIERIENAVNGYDEATVKSTDKADLEKLIEDIKALTDATNITDDERANLEDLDATADAIIKKIDDTKAEIDRINEAVNGYDIETVKSSDIPALGKLIEDIKALTDGDNITEDERAALEADDAAVDALIEKLAEVAKEINRVDEAVKSYDENTVKSTDKEDLAQLKEDVQALIDSTNTTENEKTALGEMIEKIEVLEDKIEEIEQQLEKIADIENGYNPETVTSDDKAAIEDTIAEIEAVNPDNLTDEQKAEYEEIKADLETLLDEIAAAGAEVDAIGVETEMFDKDRVTIFWEEDIEAVIAEIDTLLADTNMGTAEKAKLNEYKAQAEELIEIINNPWEYFSLRLFYFIWDCLNWKYNGILWLLSKIFGYLGIAC